MRAEIIDGVQGIQALAEPWRRLEQRSLEPNAFLSPRFVLPALTWLATPAPPWASAWWPPKPWHRPTPTNPSRL